MNYMHCVNDITVITLEMHGIWLVMLVLHSSKLLTIDNFQENLALRLHISPFLVLDEEWIWLKLYTQVVHMYRPTYNA